VESVHENIFNSALFQMDYKFELNAKSKYFWDSRQFTKVHWTLEEMKIKQNLFWKKCNSQTFGGRLGWQNKEVEVTLNYNRITIKEGI
jgi:hypothetical protein